jgi:hypothetical protein
MKKKTINILLVFITLITVSSINFSCNDKLDDKFYDPLALTNPSFEMLFTGVLQTGGMYRPDYGEEYHNLRNMNRLLGLGYFVGAYSGGPNTLNDDASKMYTGWSGGTLRNTLYKRVLVDAVKNIPYMNLQLKNMSAEDQANYELYVLCVNIVKAHQFQRLTDVYDDVPYSEAGGAYDGKFWPKYDNQKDIYYSLLDMLKTISTKLKGYTLNSSLAHQNFLQFDILNNGNVSKWEKFCNSLRLRMAIRLSVVDPAKSKAVISDIISSNAPLLTEASDFIGFQEKNKAQMFEIYWVRSFNEVYYNQYAPEFLMKDVFGYNGPATPADDVDPRVYALFQPNVKGDYIGLKPWGPAQTQQINDVFPTEPDHSKVVDWNFDENIDPYFSMYNKMTYYNFDILFPVFTPSETQLLLAEAALRFPDVAGSINVKDAYKKAIAMSIDWWYNVNNTNTYSNSSTPAIPGTVIAGSQHAKPAQAVIDAFLTKKSNAFDALSKDEKIKNIFYQKFAHLNILGQYEIWSEARRLVKEYGNLLPKSTKVEWIERFMYPENEPSVNPDKFAAVAGQNDYFTPVWFTGRKGSKK